MPANYTPNYQLNQWERTDKVLMDDFNADNAKIDAALAAEASARTAAVSALNTALALRGNCRVETFTYTGTGVNPRPITFSARPVFFILAGGDSVVFSGGPGGAAATIFNMDGRSANQPLTTSWSGNSVTITGDSRGVANRLDYQYQAVAFFAEDA